MLEKNLDLLTEQAKCFLLAFLCGNYFLARFLVLKVGKLFNVLRGKEKLGYTDDDLSPGQQPPSEQAAGQRSEHMYICGSLKKGYVCGSLL